MRALVSKTLDGREYEFEQFKTTTAIKVLAKLTKILGEPLAIAMGSFFKGPSAPKEGRKLDPETGLPMPQEKPNLLDQEISSDALSKAVRVLIERLDEVDVVDLVEQLSAKSVLCDHKPIIFDMHYQGDIGHLFKVLAAALEVQYGNFFSAITGPLSNRTATVMAGVTSGISRA